MKTKKKAKSANVAPKPVKAKARKPEMPDKILRDFLEEKCELSKLKDVSQFRAGFLWEKGNVQRYRINVWKTTYEMDNFCPTVQIIRSYFVSYDPDEQIVVDKTEHPKGKTDILGRIRK